MRSVYIAASCRSRSKGRPIAWEVRWFQCRISGTCFSEFSVFLWVKGRTGRLGELSGGKNKYYFMVWEGKFLGFINGCMEGVAGLHQEADVWAAGADLKANSTERKTVING